MIIKKTALQNFLSYTSVECTLDAGLNILVGRNAAGKTNFIESAYFSALGKSARGFKDKELVRWEAKEAQIFLEYQKGNRTHTLGISIDAAGKKRILSDGIPLSKTGELLGNLNVVYFSPDGMKLIKEAPADRRRFLDVALCQQDRLYFYTLMRYNKLLTQRNKLLKNCKSDAEVTAMNAIIVAKLIECQSLIVKKRADFLRLLAPAAQDSHAKITDGKETLALEYEGDATDENAVSTLSKLYEQNFEKDKKQGFTSVGIHRDDIKISAGNIDVRRFGSQGQQRTAVLSLKLAEVALFKKLKGTSPVLILDDVLSELDEKRQRALLNAVSGTQTIITCTDFNKSLAENAVIFRVENGKIF